MLARRGLLKGMAGGAAAVAAAPIADRVAEVSARSNAMRHMGTFHGAQNPINGPLDPDSLSRPMRSLWDRWQALQVERYERPRIGCFDLDIASMRSWSPSAALLAQHRRERERRDLVERAGDEFRAAMKSLTNPLGKLLR